MRVMVGGSPAPMQEGGPATLLPSMLPKAQCVGLVEALNRDYVGNSWGCWGRERRFLNPNNFSREELEVQEEVILQEDNLGEITT